MTGVTRLNRKVSEPVSVAPARFVAKELAVRRLSLTDFRCYRSIRLETGGANIVLTGPNGAGKTNLLEALSFLVPGRGLKRATLAEVSRREADEPEGAHRRAWAVAGRLNGPDGPVDLGTGLDAADLAQGRERRVIRVDGDTAAGQAALAEHLAMVWLTPGMDRLFVEGASGRRRFLDRLVYASDPAHAGRVSAYEQAMRERQRLLNDAGGRADPAWLSALEATMAEKGCAVAAARAHMVEALAAACADDRGPFPAAGVRLDGEIEAWLAAGPALEAEDRLRAALAAARQGDAETGRTGTGPHRSDLAVVHLGKGRPAGSCSTGEQKALLISIVLAHGRLRGEERGRPPLLLLDEVAAHLDGERREALFDILDGLGGQAWLTGTDPALFGDIRGRAEFFHVEDAIIRPAD